MACHFAPESTGSAPYNSLLIETLAAAGANVDAVVGVPHYPQWKVQDPRYRRGLRWREIHDSVRVTRVRHAVPSHPGLIGRMRQESTFAALAAPYVAHSRADVVIAVTPLVGAMLAATVGRRKRPLGVVVHDLSGAGAAQSGTAGAGVARVVGAAEFGLLARADRVGVITQGFSRALAAHNVDPSRIVELPIFTHVASSDASRADARRSLGWPTPGTYVVHTGNMGMKQGLDHAIEAAKLAESRAPEVVFVLVGDGNQISDLRSRAEGLGNVRFVPPVSEADYPEVLAAADVLLLHEKPGVVEMSLPSKLTSYVTAGRPIVAAVETQGITKALLDKHESALCVASGDPAALVDAVGRVSADSGLAEELVASAKRMGAAEFSDERGRDAFRRFAGGLAR